MTTQRSRRLPHNYLQGTPSKPSAIPRTPPPDVNLFARDDSRKPITVKSDSARSIRSENSTSARSQVAALRQIASDCSGKLHLTFIPQYPIQRAKTRVIVDGALLDTYHLAHGYWERQVTKRTTC